VALVVAGDSPVAPDVVELLTRHLAFANESSPREAVHALPAEHLVSPDVLFFGARDDGVLLGVGALRLLGSGQAELKSMHTAVEARGRGVGRAVVRHLLAVARENGCERVSLETGSMEAFAPARALYASEGFEPCGPFGDYPENPNSAFMTLRL
jgi:putative acetyltransferase